jgi:hypothetical protein
MVGGSSMASATKENKYQELDELRLALERRVNSLRSELRKSEAELQSVATTIDLLNRGKVGTEEQADSYLRSFRGLTHIDALVKLARDNGNNRFKVMDAKRVLVAAGLIKSKKNASNILFNDIQRSERFKRVGPGEYELLVPSAPNRVFPSPASISLTSQYDTKKQSA